AVLASPRVPCLPRCLRQLGHEPLHETLRHRLPRLRPRLCGARVLLPFLIRRPLVRAQRKEERRPLPRLALHPHPPPSPPPRPPATYPPPAHPLEHPPDLLLLPPRNPDPVVPPVHRPVRRAHLDPLVLRRVVLHPVGDQVPQDLRHPHPVARHRRQRLYLQ